jgi:hypothetical protein
VKIRAEVEQSRRAHESQKFVEAGLVEWRVTSVEQRNLRLVNVHAGYPVSEVSQADPCYCSDISRANDGNPHSYIIVELEPSGEAGFVLGRYPPG